MSKVFAMGGYEVYVWGSVALALAVFVWNALAPALQRRALMQRLVEGDPELDAEDTGAGS